jgi:hypothetical protein
MIDADRLTNLILTSDFTYSELEGVAVEYLKLTPSDARDIMSATGMGRKVADLVAWSYQHDLSNQLSAGILGFERSKRAVREWMLTGDDMPNDGQGNSTIERRVERLEQMLGDRLTYVERELQRLAIAVESRARAEGTLNWAFVLMAIMLALIVAIGTTALAVLR